MTIIARANQLELRLTRDATEIEAAQRLRYRVFYEEMGAVPTPAMLQPDRRRPVRRGGRPSGRGRPRPRDRARLASSAATAMLRESVARQPAASTPRRSSTFGGACAHGEIMELGRSCVEPEYRTGAVMQLLWRGIADYIDATASG